MRGQLAGIVGIDAGCDYGAAHSACATDGDFARDVDIDGVLILGKKGDMRYDGKRACIGSENGDLANASIEGLCY